MDSLQKPRGLKTEHNVRFSFINRTLSDRNKNRYFLSEPYHGWKIEKIVAGKPEL